MKNNVISIGREEESPMSGRRAAIRKDHDEALRTFAVEAYLLDELSEEQQMCFEEHCLECAICAKSVEAGRTFIAHIAPLVEEPAPRQSWFERNFKIAAKGLWLKPVAAMAILSLPVIGWQQVTISDLTAPHANTVILAKGGQKSVPTRGGRIEAYPLKTASATIEFARDSIDELQFPYYRVRISGGQGKNFSQVVPAPGEQASHRFSVQVLRNGLGSGHFAVELEGLASENAKDGQKLDEVYEFDLK